MDDNDTLFRTNVQRHLSPEALAWAEAQWLKRAERMDSLSRDDYYSVLGDLYRQINPPAAATLLREVTSWSPPIEWLDRAITLNAALLRSG